MQKYPHIKNLITVAVLIIGISVWFVFFGMPKNDEGTKNDPLIGENLVSESQTLPSGLMEYHNIKYGFSFTHTPEAKIAEYDEGGGAMTITLENLEPVQGMQIFIIPYAGKTISDERFKADVPSGVREDVRKATVAGVEAVAFSSQDVFLGETQEIWFIKNGYLFEVTTFKNSEDWFTSVMGSWRFDE